MRSLLLQACRPFPLLLVDSCFVATAAALASTHFDPTGRQPGRVSPATFCS